MKTTLRNILFLALVMTIILTACGVAASEAPASYEVGAESMPPVVEMQEVPAMGAPMVDSAKAADGYAESSVANAPEPVVVSVSEGNTLPDVVITANRMIIKNAELKLLVADTDTAIDRATQVVGDVGGYIISSRVWYQDDHGRNFKYSSITIGVPVEQFETAMRRLRAVAVKVLDENASGEDVTDQFVDLQSQVENLQATRDRIRGFLNDAKTVEEALRVNQQLTEIEAQIAETQGRINYLKDRSAVSTITVYIEPEIPPVTPTPTLTPAPTVTPVPWNPGKTFGHATDALIAIYQGIIELLIWIFVVIVPIILPPILIVWLVWFLVKRSKKS